MSGNTAMPNAIANILRSPLTPSLILATASCTTPAVAQVNSTSTPAQLEEVVVTAERREERLQDTAIAITVLDAKDLAERGADNLLDVARVVPNVSMSAGTGGSGASYNLDAFIRGVGQWDWLITTQPGVGIYVDGVFFPRATGGVLNLLDVQRIEVLRGPQGTLFGRNAVGGAVNIVTAAPSDKTGSQVEGTVGSYGRREFKGYVDLASSETLQTRLSMAYTKADGYTSRVLAGDDTGGIESLTGRLRTAMQFTPTLALDMSIDGTRSRDEAPATLVPFFKATGNLYPLWKAVATPVVDVPGNARVASINSFLAATGNAGAFPNPDRPLVSHGTGPNVSDLDMGGARATLTWDVAKNLRLTSISAWRGLDATFGRDGDNTPIQYISTLERVKQRQFSQELQWLGKSFDDRLKWVGGLFYFDEKATDRNTARLASGLYAGLEALPGALIPLAPGIVCPPPPGVLAPCAGGAGNLVNVAFDLDFDIYNKTRFKSQAVFMQGSWLLAERWTATFGGRYTRDDQTYFLQHDRVNAGVALIPATQVTRTDADFSPKVALDFKPTDNTMLYASVTRGFKSGGFNGRPTTRAEVEPFGPESVTAYELGSKHESPDRRWRLNAALFANDYRDMQLLSTRADATNNFIVVTENAGEARIRGVELELQALPSDATQLDFALGYLDAKLTKLAPGATVTLDNKLPNTPRWTAAAGASYKLALPDSGMQLLLRTDANFRARFFTDVNNTPALEQGAYTLLSARATLTRGKEPWSAMLFVNNLTDQRYITGGVSGLASFGTVEAVLGRPREWGLRLGYTF